MPPITYTELDVANSAKFAEAYMYMDMHASALKKSPHIASWIRMRVRQATKDDYFFPSSLAKLAQVVDFDMDESLCDRMSCNPYRADGTLCDRDDPAVYAWVGDDGYDVRCGPACYNLRTIPSDLDPNDNTDTPEPQIPRLVSNKGKCFISSAFAANYMSGSIIRSKARYLNHVNNMPTGYSLVKSNDTLLGEDYRLNPSYCNYYGLTLKDVGTKDEHCGFTGAETVVTSIFGDSFIQYIIAAIDGNLGNSAAQLEPMFKPTVPNEMDPKYELKTWLTTINPKNSEFYYDSINGGDVELINGQPAIELVNSVTTSENLRTLFDKKFRVNVEARTRAEIATDEQSLADMLKQYFDEIWDSDAVKGIVEAVFIQKVINMLKSSTDALIAALAKDSIREILANGAVEITENVLKFAMTSMLITHITNAAMDFALDFLTIVSRVLNPANIIFDVAMAVSMILTVILAKWDPSGLNLVQSGQFPHVFVEGVESTLRNQLGSHVEFTAVNALRATFDPNEMMDLTLRSMIYRIMYLDALTVNSNGDHIDKGPKITLSGAVEPAIAKANRLRHWDERTFAEYNEHFDMRVKSINKLQKISLAIAGLAVILALMQITLLSLLVFIVSLSLFAFNLMSITTDHLISINSILHYEEMR